MNKKRIIIIAIVLILVIASGLLISRIIPKQETENINTVTEVKLLESDWIDSLTKINIKDTNDYFEITEKVKWEVPEHSKDTTVSFYIAIPYTFVVDGVSYNGTYILNDERNEKPEELEYNLRVVNLTKNGKIKIELTK